MFLLPTGLFKLIFTKIEGKNPADDYGRTPLHWAADEGNLEIINLIFDKIGVKNPATKDGVTPLLVAASCL